MSDRGLDALGYIDREGSPGRVPTAFRPVVAAARDRVLDVFGARLHSAYLYGSIPRSTARTGRSDLDLLLALLLPRWRERIAGVAAGTADTGASGATGEDGSGGSEEALRPLVRHMSRHLVRTGFTLVMPRWNGWTSDLTEMAEVFAGYYPERAAQLREAAVLGQEPIGDLAVLRSYVDGLGPWLAGEYARVHGIKNPRP